MSLTPEDVDVIAKLLDARLAAHNEQITTSLALIERRARNRRRFWLWFTILSFIASGIASYIGARHMINAVEDQVSASEHQLFETRVAYQKLLAHDRVLQHDRAVAVANSGYHSEQSQADFDAHLVAQVLKLFNQAHAQSDTLAKNAAPTQADDEAAMAGMGDLVSQLGSLTTQLLLHETDPAHQSTQERALTGEANAPRRAGVILQGQPLTNPPAADAAQPASRQP